ncbi:SsgA family sporulation/cell division regulator [Kitasatospora sp. NBC_00315]|uniref:SsgA family sporulation/cell division regulator n=1 Tax=Kitasatospora sp. NBC_00315 TaxID=2975963 RepID=UPI003247BBA4
MSSAVEQAVQAGLILSTHRSVLLRVTLRYRSDDPLAVRMLFPAEYSLDDPPPLADSADASDAADTAAVPASAAVEWVFARKLLSAGLDLPSGIGDVHVRPALGAHTMVELRATEGVALLRFRSAELRRFLRRSLLVVPEGQEHRHLDPDRALAELLG